METYRLSGTYGTNGFYLEFKDSSALGDDTSGNGNDFTVNNLTSIDQTTDTPTNNFATLNSIWGDNITGSMTYSNGNTTCNLQQMVIAILEVLLVCQTKENGTQK
jgi:hypothetical protein